MKQFHHVCILSCNYEESIKFYTKVLGGNIIKEKECFHGRLYNSWIQLGDVKIELQTPRPNDVFATDDMVKQGPVHIAFLVEDTEKMYSEIVDKGYGCFMMKNGKAIYEVYGEKLFKLIAPEGTIIEFRDAEIS